MGELVSIPETIQQELDRRLFHLKTLCDVSRELLGVVEVRPLLKNFLLMTTGNFGVIEGFVLIRDTSTNESVHFVAVGLSTREKEEIQKAIGSEALPPSIVHTLQFKVDDIWEGTLGLGGKIIGEDYTSGDRELITTLVNNLVIALKNARYAEALKEAYEEVSSLNRAKDKVINHLSHELKTPIALLKGALTQLERKLEPVSPELWQRTLKRAQRNVERLIEMQYEIEDIMDKGAYKVYTLMSGLIEQCADELEELIAEEVGDTGIVERIRQKVEEIFGVRKLPPEEICLDRFVTDKLREMMPMFDHRKVMIRTRLSPTAPIMMPSEPVEKIFSGLLRNAIENTPDEGEVLIRVEEIGKMVRLAVEDRGIGIVPEHQQRIFEGFFPTQETIDYSSKSPFEFNAGGKGADLLRMKIFSERYNFKIEMESERCRYIPSPSDQCPGRISACEHCSKTEDCMNSGGSVFRVVFPVRVMSELK